MVFKNYGQEDNGPEEQEEAQQMIQTFKTLKNQWYDNQKHTLTQTQRPLGLGNSMGDMAAHRYRSALR